MVLECLGAGSDGVLVEGLGVLELTPCRGLVFPLGPRDLHRHASSPALAYDQRRREGGSWGTTRCSMREVTVLLLWH